MRMAKSQSKNEAQSQGWADGMVGHDAITDILRRAIASDRLAHAYLFAGPDGAGKTTLARKLATELLGVTNPETHPDFTFVERERDAKTGKLHAFISIDQVQALTARLSMGSMMAGWRVAILDGAHLLNDASANALLKRLEEPHPKTLLILTSQAAEQVMPTIRSRCQVLRFGRVATPVIAAALAERGIDADRSQLYARLADGRPGVALGYAADPAALDEMYALRDAILGMPASAIADRFSAIEKAVPPKLPFLDAVHRSQDWSDLAAELLRDAMLLRIGADDRVVHVDAAARLKAWSGSVDAVRALTRLAESRRMLASNVTPRATLERVVAGF